MITRRTLVSGLAAGAATLVSSVTARAGEAPWRPAAQFLQPVTRLVPATGGVALSKGWCGTKVSLVQRAVGLAPRHEVYDDTTRWRVLTFQRRTGLPATGIVDVRTWAALRTGQPWTIDAWRPSIAVPANATRSQRVEAMIRYAVAQQGSPYTWGGAGPKALGHDCSGLVLAALAAAGIDPQPITVTRHQSPGYVTTQALYTARFEHVPVARRQRGDLVFWTGPDGITNHVAIYLGAGRMVEASGSAGRTRVANLRFSSPGHRLAPVAVRPFTTRAR
ncbi:NlpC/P60 family protein [Arsenicicoccus dermatophilus]|uniref:C40 family peptidase n=1 Tax=Arsenicicoccus dermatophilus TaxID=1076331 RepID=UPI0039170F6D